MSADTTPADVAALIELHRGLERKGPGDAAFTRDILLSLPVLPPNPRIADLGCGSGAGTLVLAEHYRSHVVAVDLAASFIEELAARAKEAGLDDLITPLCADMARLDWLPASVDLLWSEGAAYALGFEQALRLWRPLLSGSGLAVISDMTWFTDERPPAAARFWEAAYPTMASEEENRARAARAGFVVRATQRLPASAWWRNYYDPLRVRLDSLAQTPTSEAVVRETREEMALFQQYSACYGYTFYVLQPAGATTEPERRAR